MSLLLLFGPAGTAAPAGAPTLTARIDWENGGTFDSGIDSCAGRVLGGSWRRGRSADFNTDATGSASLILDNFDDRYTPDRNWCDNPSFESGVTGWSTTAIASLTAAATSIAQVTDSAPSAGTKAGEAVLTATLNSGVTYPIPYAFRAGVTYAVSVHLKSTAGALTVRAGLASSGTPADLASSGTDITTSWAAYTFAWTPTADRTDAVFFLRTTTAAAATVRIDAVQVNPVVGYGSAVQALGPAAHWRLDELSGTVAADSSGHGFNGTYVNTPTLGGEPLTTGGGRAVALNGTDEHVSVPSAAGLNMGLGSFTVIQWVRFPTGSSQLRWSAGKGLPYGNGGPGWAIAHWTTADPVAMAFYISDGTTGLQGTPGVTVARGAIAMVAWVVDRSAGTVTSYLNGSPSTPVALPDGFGSVSTTESLLIGSGNGPHNQTPGDFDEHSLFDRALPAAEIAALYAAGTMSAAANAYLEAPTKGQLVPGRPVHIYSTYSAADYPEFFGYIERLTPQPGNQTVDVTCYDVLRRMQDEIAVSEFTQWTRSIRDCRRHILDEFERGSYNLIANPAFVADTKGWYPSASVTLTRITTDGPAGETTCAEVTGGAAWNDVVQTISLANRFPTGQITRTSFYARSISGSTTLTIRQSTGTGVIDSTFTLTSAWQRFSFVQALAASAYSIGTPAFYISMIAATGQTYRIGALMLTRGPQLHPYSRTGIGRAANLAESADFDRIAFAWQNAFRNHVGNPSFETDTSGWSVAGDAFVTAATSITRSTTYAKYGTACAAVAVTAAAQGVFYAITGTFKTGRVYQISAWCAPPVGLDGSKPTLGIGSQGTPTDKAEVLGPAYGAVPGVFVKLSTNWTPSADRTDAHVYIKPVNISTSATFYVDAVLVTELDYSPTYFDTGPSSGAHLAATSLALATVDSRTVYAITCPATAGAGAAYQISFAAKTRFVGGVQYYLGLDVRAAAACSVKIGLHINTGDGTFEEATTTVAATTAWQRATLNFTPTRTYTTGADDETAISADSFLTVVANDATAPTIYIDHVRLAAESVAAPFYAASAIMPGATESGSSVAAAWQGTGTVASMLAEINRLVGSTHYIAPTMAAPWYEYRVIDIATRNAATSAETISEDMEDLSGLEIGSGAFVNTQGYQIGSADAIYVSDDVSVGLYGPQLGTLLSGTLYANDTLPSLVAADITTRYAFPRTRPTMRSHNRWPSQLQRQLGDVVTVTLSRQRVYAQPYSILALETSVTRSGQDWVTTYILEELA